jgi:long-chain acyl-CoA synthetase
MAAAAGWLLAHGVEPGDRVVFCLDSSADYLCAVLGAVRVGIIPVLLNTTLLSHERDALVLDAEPKLTFLTEGSIRVLFDGPPAEMSDYPLTRPMHFTSGTTGRAKGVTTGVWDDETAKAAFEDEADAWCYDARDLHLVNSPMYHTVAVRLACATLLSGGSVALASRFDAHLALQVLRELRPTSAFFVPTQLHRLLSLPELGVDERFDSLRLLTHAGAPCPPVLKREALERVGDDVVFEFYGSTEGQFTLCSTEEWRQRPGTVGRARKGRQLSIVPVDDASPTGGDPIGTIWCEAPAFARFSYFGDDAATKAAWNGDAFSVGDLGSLDADGYLYLNGRRTDLIISGGVNVYPAEVEAALAEIDGISQVCVFAREDDDWGQRVCAAVVGRPGLTGDDVLEAAKGVLAPYKRPKEVFFTSTLPVGSTGKVLRDKVAGHLGLSERAV